LEGLSGYVPARSEVGQRLETRCDKSGDVQTIALLREDRDALKKRVEELEAEVNRLKGTEMRAMKGFWPRLYFGLGMRPLRRGESAD
jgi:hypothetical protein